MRYALAFGGLAAVLGVLAARAFADAAPLRAALGVVETYFALSFAALGLTYLMRAAGAPAEAIFDRPTVRWLLRPYRAAGRLTLVAVSTLGREPAWDALADELVVGRLPFDRELPGLRAEGIDAVLNLCWEFPGLASGDGLSTARVPILDGVPPTFRQFDEAVEQVARWRSEGRRVLIHCAQGHGRTATVAAACLVRMGLAADAADALALVRAARPGARPSKAQAEALRRYLDDRVKAGASGGPA